MTSVHSPATIVVTRPEGEEGPLTRALRKAGQKVPNFLLHQVRWASGSGSRASGSRAWWRTAC